MSDASSTNNHDIAFTNLPDIDCIISKLDRYKMVYKRNLDIQLKLSVDKTLIAYSTNMEARCVGQVENDYIKCMITVLKDNNVQYHLKCITTCLSLSMESMKITVSLSVDSRKFEVVSKAHATINEILHTSPLSHDWLLSLHYKKIENTKLKEEISRLTNTTSVDTATATTQDPVDSELHLLEQSKQPMKLNHYDDSINDDDNGHCTTNSIDVELQRMEANNNDGNSNGNSNCNNDDFTPLAITDRGGLNQLTVTTIIPQHPQQQQHDYVLQLQRDRVYRDDVIKRIQHQQLLHQELQQQYQERRQLLQQHQHQQPMMIVQNNEQHQHHQQHQQPTMIVQNNEQHQHQQQQQQQQQQHQSVQDTSAQWQEQYENWVINQRHTSAQWQERYQNWVINQRK
jgi:hypothetical protein